MLEVTKLKETNVKNLTKLSIPKDLRDHLKQIAKAQGMSMLTLLRVWVDRYETSKKNGRN